MTSFRGHAQQWRIFRMASAGQLKWKELHSTGHQQKHSVIFKKSVLWSQHRRGEFMNEPVKVLSQRFCYVSSHFFKWVYGNPWPLLVGISRIPAYNVDYTTDLHNPLWDWARIASVSATFYSTKLLSIKRRCSLSTDHPIITQKPGVQASPLLHSPPETLRVRGRDIIAAFIQWPSSFEALKKTV